MARIEVPIGMLTAIVGAPFFLWLLARGREGWSVSADARRCWPRTRSASATGAKAVGRECRPRRCGRRGAVPARAQRLRQDDAVQDLLGLLPAQGGEVALDGEPLAALRAPQIARRVAYVPQAHAG